MKIINSIVRNVTPDIVSLNDPRIRGMARRPKAIVQAKKIARKRERAMLRQLAAKEYLQDQLAVIAEKREAARIERETAYSNLMHRMKQDRKSKRLFSAKQRHAILCTDLSVEETWLEARIECTVTGAQRERVLLASCAAID